MKRADIGIAGLLATLVLSAGTPSWAYSRQYNNNWPDCPDNGQPCQQACGANSGLPCILYDVRTTRARSYFFSTTFAQAWKAPYRTAVGYWNEPRHRQPVFSESDSSSGALQLGRGHLQNPAACAEAATAADSAHYIQAGSSSIVLSADIAIGTAASSPCYLQNILAHEHGHAAVGLGHTRASGALMITTSSSTVRPQQDELNALADIYP